VVAFLSHEWVIATVVGLVGGILDSLIHDGGFRLPQTRTSNNGTILDPGFLGNVLIGGGAGFASWALNNGAKFGDVQIDVGPIVAAFLAGVGGGEILTGFVRRQYLEGANQQILNALEGQLSTDGDDST
jgi:hypothetical protein